jgi:hypothetical protein
MGTDSRELETKGPTVPIPERRDRSAETAAEIALGRENRNVASRAGVAPEDDDGFDWNIQHNMERIGSGGHA